MNIVNITESNRDMVTAFFKQYWGSSEMVISTGVYNCSELDGYFVVSTNDEILGLITYRIPLHDVLQLLKIL